MKLATAFSLSAWPRTESVDPEKLRELNQEIGQRLADLVHDAHGALLVLLEPLDDLDLAFELGVLFLVRLDSSMIGLRRSNSFWLTTISALISLRLESSCQ